MNKVKACGVLVFRKHPTPAFLLMKHHHRWDLPKGHVEEGESERECALREMWEETGIGMQTIQLDTRFKYSEIYYPYEARFGPGRVEKTLVIFLGWLETDHPITVTEHIGHQWILWPPPLPMQKFTIDPLLTKLQAFFAEHGIAFPASDEPGSLSK